MEPTLVGDITFKFRCEECKKESEINLYHILSQGVPECGKCEEEMKVSDKCKVETDSIDSTVILCNHHHRLPTPECTCQICNPPDKNGFVKKGRICLCCDCADR